MADSAVNLAAPTGMADTRTASSGDHRQVVVLGNDGDTVVGVEPFGALSVALAPVTTFYDQFASALDTVEKWNVIGGTPTFNAGDLVMPTTVSTYNMIRSKDTLKAEIGGYSYVAHGVQLETGVGTGAGRFWGLGTQASTPSATSLVQDGIGFEIDQTSGALNAVTYAAGVRTVVAALTRPTDGALHRYAVYFRVTQAYWFIDNMQVSVASLSFPSIQVAELPVAIVRNNGAAFTNSPVFETIAVGAGDTARNSLKISDSIVPARQSRVTDPSMLANAANSGSAGPALNVNPNAIQKATYMFTSSTSTGALSVGTAKAIASLHHAASATRTLRIRRIFVGLNNTTATASAIFFEIRRGTAATTAGTAFVPLPTNPGTAAAEVTANINPTIVAATILHAQHYGTVAASGSAATQVIYDWQEVGETIPLTLRAGALDSLSIWVTSSAAVTITPYVTIIFTEE